MAYLEPAAFLLKKIKKEDRPVIGIICGSGLAKISDNLVFL